MKSLLGLDLGGHRRLVLINHSLYQGGAWYRQRTIDDVTAFRGRIDCETGHAEPAGDRCEVNRLQLADIFGIPEEYHLLPFDLAECIVLNNEELDRKIVF